VRAPFQGLGDFLDVSGALPQAGIWCAVGAQELVDAVSVEERGGRFGGVVAGENRSYRADRSDGWRVRDGRVRTESQLRPFGALFFWITGKSVHVHHARAAASHAR
jgi:hypothetical protein